VRLTLPGDHQVACTGTVVGAWRLPDGRQRLDIEACGVRDFALLCSAAYRVFEGHVEAAPGVRAVRVRVLALPEHEYYARRMVDIACRALRTYSLWFGPYPWPDFTIAEAFFGWNGNECATLVMIDERIFGMPHLAEGYAEYLISHEICHQWWYNLIGTNGYAETWMDEALAVHFTHRLLNQSVGRNNPFMRYPRGLEWLPNIRRDDYRSAGMYGCFGRGENGPVVRDMPNYLHLVDLFNHCYDKGGRIVGMIEERLGEVAFMDFMRIVANRYRYRILRIADFRRELELYTGKSWQEFFHNWLYDKGLCDWAVEKVVVTDALGGCCGAGQTTDAGKTAAQCHLADARGRAEEAAWLRQNKDLLVRLGVLQQWCFDLRRYVRVVVWLRQKAEYNEQTILGLALPNASGYPVRLPILPQAGSYQLQDPPASVQVVGGPAPFRGGVCVRVEVLLPCRPTQVAVDPDQTLLDRDPSNNFWHRPVRWRLTPLYTFLEESDLTAAYDRWNIIAGPWIYGTAYNDAWYTRSNMVGVRLGAYRTQEFSGGAYSAFRTDVRDLLVGVDGFWDHWPVPRMQAGFNVERRVAQVYQGDNDALRGVLWTRYVFQYGSSLYLPPMHYLEGFTAYQDNFLPFAQANVPGAVRFDRTTTVGLHYRLNYLTPYWDPEGGFQFDAYYEGGDADLPQHVGLEKLSGQFTIVKAVPDLSHGLWNLPAPVTGVARPVLEWLGDTRVALRLYGGTSMPSRGEFFTMGGAQLFRGFDLAQRQGSTVWVGSLEWRVPLAKGLNLDVCDHIMGVRNIYGAAFYDVGDAYANNRSVGSVAHALGAGLRVDVAWFGFVERTILRLDVAKAVNTDNAVQFWFGVMHPF
jgi:hypothetical protein